MRNRPLLLLLTFALLAVGTQRLSTAVTAAAGVSTATIHDAVVDLNDANFDEELEGRDVVVTFFAPWCGQCTIFKPIYAAWAKELAATSDSPLAAVKIARLDCTLNPETAEAQKIRAYPTVRLYHDKRVVASYTGGRTSAELTAWLKQHTPHLAHGTATLASKSTSAAATPAQQQAKQHSSEKQSSSSQDREPFGIFFDFNFDVDFSNAEEVKRLLREIADTPKVLFREHPYLVISVIWLIGIFQGLALGVLCTLRDRR